LHIVRLNDDNDVKLTVGGRLFQRFITRSVKKFCRTPLVHRCLNILFGLRKLFHFVFLEWL